MSGDQCSISLSRLQSNRGFAWCPAGRLDTSMPRWRSTSTNDSNDPAPSTSIFASTPRSASAGNSWRKWCSEPAMLPVTFWTCRTRIRDVRPATSVPDRHAGASLMTGGGACDEPTTASQGSSTWVARIRLVMAGTAPVCNAQPWVLASGRRQSEGLNTPRSEAPTRKVQREPKTSSTCPAVRLSVSFTTCDD